MAAETQAGRRCLVLSDRKSHLARIVGELRELGVDPLVLHGGMKRTSELEVMDRLEAAADGPLVLVATGQYVGEGFDCPPLDTLFLAFPISDKGKIVQRVGRIQRPFPGKQTARVHDYLDAAVPVLARMHARRRRTYRTLGLLGDADEQPQLDLGL
jgi:superfamily II DNA or RNA helicase